MVNTEPFHIRAGDASRGLRLDAFMVTALPDLSRARIQMLIENGQITHESKPLRPSYKIKGNETFIVRLPQPRPSHLLAQDLPLSILYQDADIIVINKPAGMVVHPGAGNREGTLVNALLYHFPGLHVGDVERPGLVHRLDKETSGVMVCARNDHAHLFLTQKFKSRDVVKKYRAFCVGTFKEQSFELITGHRRHLTDRKRFTTRLRPPTFDESQPRQQVRMAHSRFEVLLAGGGISELKVHLFTGRTHQIRAHLADIGRPLVQDSLYGGVKAVDKLPPSPVRSAAKQLHRHALHAEYLSFVHPSSGKRLEFEAPLSDDLLLLHCALKEM